MLTVSVVMPVYNVERHVARSLTALLALRIPDGVAVSLIVVDDHCADASMDVVAAMLRDAPFPVQILRHPVNLGRAVARNTGLAAATGEFVWFVDSDDWVAPGLLAALAGAVTPEVDVVVADVVPVREDGVRERRVVRPGAGALWRGPQAVEEYLFQRIPAHLVNQLIRTELFDGIEFPAGRLHDDVAVCARLLRRARAVAYVPGPAY
jgi:glycosyltransferase involved in cell wall biosynthesis